MKAESFDSIIIDENGTTAETSEYEVLRTSDGVRISHYVLAWDIGDTPKDEYLTRRTEGGEELYLRVLDLVNKCEVKSWDGFSKSDPYVLDGTMFTMTGNIDGKDISASGSNAFPQGFSEFEKELRDILYEN